MLSWLRLTMLCLVIGGCGPSPADYAVQPESGTFLSGLLPRYTEGKFRHIDQMPSNYSAWSQGSPVAALNHRFGYGEVFDSGKTKGVGVCLTGQIELSQTGSYRFRALANDGIRVLIGNQVIFEDPGVHGDRWSPQGVFGVEQPGRYPLTVLYFQRKGSATLVLEWMRPGESDFSPVPAEAFSHPSL